MGLCCFKSKTSDASYVHERSPQPSESTVMDTQPVQSYLFAEQSVIDKFVLQMLVLISSFYKNDGTSPPPLIRLHNIAEKEQGWLQVIISMIKVIPVSNPLGPSTISIIFDDCPLPTKESVIKLSKRLRLSKQRATANNLKVAEERNICIVLGCVAEKLVGPNSVAVLTDDILDYLVTFLVDRVDPNIVLFALIALEKFARTTENKLTIQVRLNAENVNRLSFLEIFADSEDCSWRQVGFCAKWALENIFVSEQRIFSYLTVNMSSIQAILNTRDVSEYLKISPNGLEARSDTHSFESVRCTFQVDQGCWYYEVMILTSGVMQIGWATKNSHFLNHEGYGIGDDLYSLSYDGCRQLIWYRATPSVITDMPKWKAGDILGCLIDLELEEAIFSLNGQRLPPCSAIFQTVKSGFFAAASFMAFQQCQFNFGHQPFKFPPSDRHFDNFNDFGYLTEEEKMVMPRKFYLETLTSSNEFEDSCTLCYDDVASCILEPCGHRGFCSLCTSMLKECPMCRGPILNIRQEIKSQDVSNASGDNDGRALEQPGTSKNI